jgi:hypothetical protein
MKKKTRDYSKWVTITRKNPTAAMPFGYKYAEGDMRTIVPDMDIVPIIEDALDQLDQGRSYRDTAAWIAHKTGKSISHQAVSNIWHKHRGRKKSPRSVKQREARKASEPQTKEERELVHAKNKLRGAKRSITVQSKKLAVLSPTKTPEATVGPSESLSEGLDHTAVPKEREVVFAPNAGPQTEFLAASEREVLYGGAAGGGKSYALLADPMRYFGNPNFMGLILRRTNDELRELIWKSQELYPRAYPGAKWQEKKSQWIFPSGSRLWFTYLERDEDVLRYQGQAFSYIGFDEITQHATPFAWDYMRSRLRTTDPSLPVFMRATTNPGGPGHGWVKAMFIDPSPANTAFPARDLDTGEVLRYPESHALAGKALFFRRFIPATLKDNPYLYEGGQYEANLLSLPEMQRRQLLEGDWNVAQGAAFPEFRTSTHVIEPFEIPHDWRRFRSCDFGYSSHSAVHWFAIDPNFETLYVYRELYVSKHTGRDLARAVLQAEQGERIEYGVLDSSCWHQRGQLGPSIAEEMIQMGCRWRPSDRTHGARIAGKNRLHEVLKIDPVTEKPSLMIFNNCRQIIADLGIIPGDPKGGEDIDQRYANDHTYDSIRYGVMSRPRSRSPWGDFGIPQKASSWRPADAAFGY